MPVQGNPGRTLSGAIDDVQDTKRARELGKQSIQSGISPEVITKVLPNGSYTVAGRELFTTGDAKGLLAGMIVPVAWRNGEPQVILDHNARRAQFKPALVPTGNPVVEELFFASDSLEFNAPRRLWFRNGTDFRPIMDLGTSQQPPVIGGIHVDIREVFWGRASPNHFVLTGFNDDVTEENPVIAVFALNRPTANEPFPAGFRITPKLVRLYNLSSPTGPSFGTISVTNGAGTASNPMRVFSSAGVAGQVLFAGPFAETAAQVTTGATCRARYEGVALNGDLLLQLVVNHNTTITGPNPGQITLVGTTIGTLLVNLTRGTVLAAHAPDRFTPLFVRLQNSITPPNPETFACFAVTGGANVSTGHNTDSGARGDASMISVKMVGNTPATQVPTLNQYVLVEHEDLSASGSTGPAFNDPSVCYPNGGSAFSGGVFRIVGEFAQVISTLIGGTALTAQRAVYQSSRTHTFWAKVANSAFLTPLKAFLTDLRIADGTGTAEIGNNPAAVVDNPSNVTPLTSRQMVAVRSGLIYAPQGPSTATPPKPPFNVQFFVKGGVKPPGVISQSELKTNGALQKAATLKEAKTPLELFILATQGEESDLQSLNGSALGTFKSTSAL